MHASPAADRPTDPVEDPKSVSIRVRTAAAGLAYILTVSIGCGLGVASLGLIDIPLVLTDSVIGLGERGRVLLRVWWVGLRR